MGLHDYVCHSQNFSHLSTFNKGYFIAFEPSSKYKMSSHSSYNYAKKYLVIVWVLIP